VQVMRRDMRIQQMTENEKHLRDAAATVLTFFNFFLFFPFKPCCKQTRMYLACTLQVRQEGKNKKKQRIKQPRKEMNK